MSRGWVIFRLNFRSEGYLYRQHLWTIGGWLYYITLLLTAAQRNSVADIIRHRLIFVEKTTNSLSEPPFGGLRGIVRTSSIAHWIVRVWLLIHDN